MEAIDTSDGWSIDFLGSSSPPQLIINYTTDMVSADDADFDADGDVDGDDFLAWQRNVGTATGATLAMGDSDADHAVDADDLTAWKTQFGQTGLGVSASSAVPEPTAAVLAALDALAVVFGRRWTTASER